MKENYFYSLSSIRSAGKSFIWLTILAVFMYSIVLIVEDFDTLRILSFIGLLCGLGLTINIGMKLISQKDIYINQIGDNTDKIESLKTRINKLEEAVYLSKKED